MVTSPLGVLKKRLILCRIHRGLIQRRNYGLVEGVRALCGARNVVDIRALPLRHFRRQGVNHSARIAGSALRDDGARNPPACDDYSRFNIAVRRKSPSGVLSVLPHLRGCRPRQQQPRPERTNRRARSASPSRPAHREPTRPSPIPTPLSCPATLRANWFSMPNSVRVYPAI